MKEIIEVGQEQILVDMVMAEDVATKLRADAKLVAKAYAILSYYLDKPRGVKRSDSVPFSWKSLQEQLEVALDMGYRLEDVVDVMENSMKDSDFMSVDSFLKALEMYN